MPLRAGGQPAELLRLKGRLPARRACSSGRPEATIRIPLPLTFYLLTVSASHLLFFALCTMRSALCDNPPSHPSHLSPFAFYLLPFTFHNFPPRLPNKLNQLIIYSTSSPLSFCLQPMTDGGWTTASVFALRATP